MWLWSETPPCTNQAVGGLVGFDRVTSHSEPKGFNMTSAHRLLQLFWEVFPQVRSVCGNF